MTELTIEQKLMGVMTDAGVGVDVPISTIYKKLYGTDDAHSTSQQQRLGPTISRVNAKLVSLAIKPGKLKRTYRLVATK